MENAWRAPLRHEKDQHGISSQQFQPSVPFTGIFNHCDVSKW